MFPLFEEQPFPDDSYVLQFDGSCEPNPNGTAYYGWILFDPQKEVVYEKHGKTGSGVGMTNNVAEYDALQQALIFMIDKGMTNHPLLIQGDSKLVVEQVNNRWRCLKSHLRKRLRDVQTLLIQFSKVKIEWIPREQNKRADELSTRKKR